MRIFFDNVNINSSSGPNGFAKKISHELLENHEVFTSIQQLIDSNIKPDVQLSFISAQYEISPIIQRLDGIYFNTDQDWHHLNLPIYETYKIADAVIFQSNFNKKLTENFFGVPKDSYVIHNGTDIGIIKSVPKLQHTIF